MRPLPWAQSREAGSDEEAGAGHDEEAGAGGDEGNDEGNDEEAGLRAGNDEDVDEDGLLILYIANSTRHGAGYRGTTLGYNLIAQLCNGAAEVRMNVCLEAFIEI
jgi:hypothetical protein